MGRRRLRPSARAVAGALTLALGIWLSAAPAQAQFVCQNNVGGDGGSIAGPDAVACGNFSAASGNRSSAFGDNSIATGHSSSAYGPGTTATGEGSSAYGASSTARGTKAVAIGTGFLDDGFANNIAGATGTHATAAGFQARASGEYSSAFGTGAKAEHANSAAFGNGATTTRDNQQVFGTASNTYTMAGLASDASKTAQGAPTKIVTTNEAGVLAAHTAGELGLATQAELNGVKSDVTTLKSDMTVVKSDVTTLKSDVTEVKSDVKVLKSDMAEVKSDVKVLKSDMVEVKSDIVDIKSDVAGLHGDVTDLHSKLTAGLSGLQSQINGLAQRDKELADGIAISLALAQPILLAGQTFAMRVGYGNFDGSSAVGVSGAGVLMRGHAGPTSSVVLDAGIGFAPDTSKAAGRVGLTFGW